MNVLLADDQPQVRSALRLLIEQETQAQIVGEAETIEDLLHHSPTPIPETILLDWELPGLSPSNSLSLIRRTYPTAQIVAMSSRPEARQAALGAGADAFVCKGDPPETLLAILDRWGFKL